MTHELSPEERFEILDVIQRYATAVDSGRFELFDETFTTGAELDYRSAGGPCGDRRLIRVWLEQSRAGLIVWQHHLSPPKLRVVDGRPLAETDVYTPNLFRGESGAVEALHTGGRYHDELERTPAGWRISKRRFEMVWVHGAGVGSMVPDPSRGAAPRS